jgi:hypothetical protein
MVHVVLMEPEIPTLMSRTGVRGVSAGRASRDCTLAVCKLSPLLAGNPAGVPESLPGRRRF